MHSAVSHFLRSLCHHHLGEKPGLHSWSAPRHGCLGAVRLDVVLPFSSVMTAL